MQTPAIARFSIPARRVAGSVLVLGTLAALAAAPVAAGPPGEPGQKDVTITVVSDPDQLNEKVNRISLPPAADEPANASPKHGKEPERAKETEDAHEKAAHEADSRSHDAGDKSESDANAKPDTSDAPHQDTDHAEAGGGD